MDKIECVGFSVKDLTPNQVTALERLAKHTDGLLGIRVFPSIDVQHHSDNIPTGIALYMDPAAQVDPTLIHDRLFETMGVSRVRKGPHSLQGAVTEQVFTANKDAFLNSVQQHPKEPPHPDVRAVNMKELKPWTSELGGEGSFLGVYSKLEPNHRDKTFYLVARGTAPLIVQDLKEQVAKEQPTYRELVSDREWSKKLQNGQYMANRNTQRNIADAAAATQVAVNRIRDLGSKLPTPDHAFPVRAEPEFKQVSHSIRDARWNGKPAVAIYSGVTPRSNVVSNKGHLFVTGNPYDGLTVFVLDTAKSSTDELDAYMTETGRNEVRNGKQTPTTDAHRFQVVSWEQKEQLPVHNDIHHDAWRPLEHEPLKTVARQGGWSADREKHIMVPILVKLYNPQMERQ